MYETYFASSERSPQEIISNQAEIFRRNVLLADFLNAIPEFVVVLNQHRQIVFSNISLLDFLGCNDFQIIAGRRPGEVLDCIHSYEMEAGCGTSEACFFCGAVNAILTAQKGTPTTEECRITQRTTGEALDLRISTTPIIVDKEEFTIFSAIDIRDEKRRRALERIFFHDILNTAGGLQGIVEILSSSSGDEEVELKLMLTKIVDELIDEIRAQKILSAAETKELVPQFNPLLPAVLLMELQALYKNHLVAQKKKIVLSEMDASVKIVSDKALLKRVVGNMIKNALESTVEACDVTVGFNVKGEQIEFWVHNPTVMPREVQLQIFQRSFSTKGLGRGLGTYSMRLLSERYLHGKVSFTSEKGKGTTFVVAFPLIFKHPE